MKKVSLFFALISLNIIVFCQVTDAEKQIKTQTVDTTILGWTTGGMININTSQTSLTNWSAGGQSSVSVNGLMNLYAHNKRNKSLWENYLEIGYGSLKQKKQDWWKTDDRLDFTSKFGINASKKVYYAALINLKTQLTAGYNYPNDSVQISGFLSPGYILTAVGIDYFPTKNLTIFFAPLTSKLTVVKDDTLAAHGAFGVDPGDHVKGEFGAYIRSQLKLDLMENVTLQTKMDLFSNYLDGFLNQIDVSWEALILMKINKYITATLSTHLLYDQDITIIDEKSEGVTETYNSKIQFKEVLAIGFSLKF